MANKNKIAYRDNGNGTFTEKIKELIKNIYKKRGEEGFDYDGYYHVEDILSLHAKYNMIFGERSAGKTYACLEYALKKYFEEQSQFAYIRRWEEDTKGKRGASLFAPLIENGLIEKYSKGEYNEIYYYSGRWYLSYFDRQTMKRTPAPEPIGYAFSLSTMEHDKSTSYPKIKTCIFDEFLTRGTYIIDEFVIFCNVLSTIIRDRDDVTVFMLGNTVNKYCPYFKEMGLTNIKKMEPGQIDVYTYGDSGLTVAVEYTGGDSIRSKKASDFYFAFDNPKLQMITGGTWELDIYPHCPIKYRPMDVRTSYFIIFDDEMLQADVIKIDRKLFTFIHRKTTPIKDEDRDIIYTTKYDPRPNWKLCIDRPVKPYDKMVWSMFQNHQVYYQDNDVGDVVMNYLNWCKEQRA